MQSSMIELQNSGKIDIIFTLLSAIVKSSLNFTESYKIRKFRYKDIHF